MSDPIYFHRIAALATNLLSAGYIPAADMAGVLRDHADELAEQDGEQLASDDDILRILTKARADLAKVQEAWPEVTDYDRLQDAFRRMNAKGIITRESYTCCSTCGHHEIQGEMAAAAEQGREVRGYAFFHQQDTDRVMEGGQLYLAHGSRLGTDDEDSAVAHQIVEALTAAGFQPEWDGSTNTRIGVQMMWLRRLTD
jgi:hypothetical protein